MSYASLVKTPPGGILYSSTGLAVLASLGIHGLLWAVLPVLPFESKSLESQSQRTVGLIELTPDEQSRLPQVSTSEVTLPPFAMQPSVLPPLPPPPMPTNVLPPLLTIPPSFQLAPNNSIFSKNSPRASSPQPKTFQVPPPAPTQNNRSVQNQPLRSNELLPPPRRWTQPRVSGLPPTNGLTAQRFDPNNFPPSPPIAPLPSPPPLAEGTNPAQNITPPQNQKVATNQPTPLNPTALPEKIPDRGKQELLALRDRLARANRARSPATSPAPENTPARMTKEQIIQALQRSQPQSNPDGSVSATTADTIQRLDKFNAQQQRVQSDYPKIDTKAPIRQKIATCEKQLDGGVAYVRAVVNPQGKIISGPDLSDNSGAVDIAQAKAIVRSYSFQTASNITNYNFTIEFKYDTGKCPEPTPEASPDPQTQQSKL